MEVGSGFWTRVGSGFGMVSRVEVGFRGRISGRGSGSGFSLSELGSNFEMGVAVWFRGRGWDTRHELELGFEMGVGIEFRDRGQGLVLGRGSGSGFGTRARSGLGTGSRLGFWMGVGVDFQVADGGFRGWVLERE